MCVCVCGLEREERRRRERGAVGEKKEKGIIMGTMGGTEDVSLLLQEYYEKEVAEKNVNGKVDSVLRVYVTHRPKLVEWTVDTCEHCRLSLATANLAVLLMVRTHTHTYIHKANNNNSSSSSMTRHNLYRVSPSPARRVALLLTR